ncbi:cytochrome ubiquinol oxidase subunit I, partial [Streptomyces sp. SID7958]|nr:cytochrome ubiquinol oxidase subunit I [Streptomyces sp. SID7958]
MGSLDKESTESYEDELPVRSRKPGAIVVSWLTTTDHKTIGTLYLSTAFSFFVIGGIMALVLRAELARPGLQIVSNEQYNQMFTMHGTVMLLMFATPLFVGFANWIMPLQIGAPDVAFPRLNMFSYWLFLFGSLIALAGFLTPDGAASFGWTGYTPLSEATRSPGLGSDLWIMGLAFQGFGTILGSVNFITTIICMRAPGMTMFRMPIFTWNVLLTGVLVLLAFPVLAAALLALEVDRKFGAHVYDASNGGALLWQHLFWFFGHPEVYIIALPFFGIVSEVIPVFARKPIFGYLGLIGATIAIAGLSVTVWAHHMFATGAVLLPFFSFMTFLIAIPTGVKFFNWTGTMWRGSLSFETPMLWSVGFLVTFLFGGLTGVILASPPLDFHVTDSYFVVAHFHYVVFGTVVFAMFSGFHFWWPKFTGKMLDERLGKMTFWTLFVGFHGTFLIQHWLGAEGMPRRYSDYLAADGFT